MPEISSNVTVYTAIIAGRDELRDPPPGVTGPGVRYICFTDDPTIKSDVWDVRAAALTHADAPRAARWHKCHPDILLGDTDYSLWVDGSLVPLLHPHFLVDMFMRDADMAAFGHRNRLCVYNEIEECLATRRDSAYTLSQQSDAFLSMQHPRDAGMFETGVLLRRHSDKMQEFNAAWWENIQQFSSRDQISFNVLRQELGVTCAELGPGSVATSPYFAFNPHQYRKGTFYRKLDTAEKVWRDKVKQNDDPKSKVLIIGTGRCGTTFLIQFLTLLGLETGYRFAHGRWASDQFENPIPDEDGNIIFVDRTPPPEWSWEHSQVMNDEINAGMERNIGPNDTRETLKDLPKFIKNPRLNVGLERILQEDLISVQEVLIPVRELSAVSKSKQESGKKARGMQWFHDKKNELRKDSAAQLGELVTTLLMHDIPYTFLKFPEIVQDVDYLHKCLGSLVAHIPITEFQSAFEQLADTSKVHFNEIHDCDDGLPEGGNGAESVVLNNTADA